MERGAAVLSCAAAPFPAFGQPSTISSCCGQLRVSRRNILTVAMIRLDHEVVLPKL